MFKTLKKTPSFLKLARQVELDKIILLYLMKATQKINLGDNPNDYLMLREILQEIRSEVPRKATPVKAQNTSPFTGRSRGFYRYPKIARMEFKQLAGSGILPGFRKAS
jgi:small subunit ribosomal protein S14